MKNNLVKILATLGLIVAIALVLKGVFGVGKIGIKNLSSKTYIKFDRCYAPDEYKNFNEHFAGESKSAFFGKNSFEIDLEKNVVNTIFVRSDENVKKLKELHNVNSSKFRIDSYPIVSSSKTYIRTDYRISKSGNWVDETMEYSYTFNLKEGFVEINHRYADTHKMSYTGIWQCEEY